ncbi:MAG: DUF1801 domain-containing protein [Flavobacteriaceae bacterium]|nr:DUF1801 domain-containing protein [Flavobacteriaceae bacterium]
MQISKPKNIQEYISQFPENSAAILERIHNTIKNVAPNAEESTSYGMPAFKLKGKPLVYFCGYKNHIGFYALPSGNEAFQKKLSNYKTGKGSIQFQLDEEIPYNLIEEIVKFRVLEVEKKIEK